MPLRPTTRCSGSRHGHCGGCRGEMEGRTEAERRNATCCLCNRPLFEEANEVSSEGPFTTYGDITRSTTPSWRSERFTTEFPAEYRANTTPLSFDIETQDRAIEEALFNAVASNPPRPMAEARGSILEQTRSTRRRMTQEEVRRVATQYADQFMNAVPSAFASATEDTRFDDDGSEENTDL